MGRDVARRTGSAIAVSRRSGDLLTAGKLVESWKGKVETQR